MNGPSRSRAFRGAPSRQSTNKVSPHNLCDRCGHFRSEHRRGACSHVVVASGNPFTKCDCEGMVFDRPGVKRKTRPEPTEEQLAKAVEMFRKGYGPTDVQRKTGMSENQIAHRFPPSVRASLWNAPPSLRRRTATSCR